MAGLDGEQEAHTSLTQERIDQNRRHGFGWEAVLWAMVMAVFWLVLGIGRIGAVRSHDFLNFYVGATLAGSGRFGELYDQQAQLQLEKELVPSTPELIPFVRPHFYAIVLAPLSLLSLDAALYAWLALHVVLLIGCWKWASRRFGPDALILGSLYLPTALGIAHGQDGVFLLVIAIGAYELADKGQDGWAGGLLALGLMKFHLLFLAPLGMLVQRRWKMFRGYLCVAAGLVLISAGTGGVDGMLQYIRLLQGKNLPRLSPSPELMINIYSVGVNLGVDYPAVTVIFLLLVAAMMAVAVWRAPLWRFIAAMLPASVMAGPHVFGYDAAVLLLPVWLVSFRSTSKLSRFAALLLGTPPIFFVSFLDRPWSASPALGLLLFLAALARENRIEAHLSTRQAGAPQSSKAVRARV